jgi:hypothetical protein
MTAPVEEVHLGEIVWEDLPKAILPAPPVEIPETPAETPGRHRRATDSGEGARDDKPPPKRRPGRPRKPRPAPAPDIHPPDFSEWHDYLGNFVIKWITRGYIAFAFRGIDRWDVLSDGDNRALELDEQALSDIAKPMAHLAAKSKFGGKYGRLVMDSTDGIIAAIQLGMWMNRVNRIASKYRKAESGDGEQIREQSAGPAVSETGAPPPPGIRLNGVAPGHGFN